MTNYEQYREAFDRELSEQDETIVRMSLEHFLTEVEIHQRVATPRLSEPQRRELFARLFEAQRRFRS